MFVYIKRNCLFLSRYVIFVLEPIVWRLRKFSLFNYSHSFGPRQWKTLLNQYILGKYLQRYHFSLMPTCLSRMGTGSGPDGHTMASSVVITSALTNRLRDSYDGQHYLSETSLADGNEIHMSHQFIVITLTPSSFEVNLIDF